MRTRHPFAAFLLLPLLWMTGARGGVLENNGIAVRFDETTGFFEVVDNEAGPLLTEGRIHAAPEAGSPGAAPYASTGNGRDDMRVVLADGISVRVRLSDKGVLRFHTAGARNGQAVFTAKAAAGARAIPARLEDERSADNRVLTMVLGTAELPGARSLFDPEHDLALTAAGPREAAWRWEDGWRLRTQAPAGQSLLSLRIQRNYYRTVLDIEHYAPIRKRARWTTAPVVAMTWYGIKGWEGNPAQRKEWLYPQIDWVAEHLLPYSGTLVFQLDDNYLYNDDAYMRELSDYIRGKGLVPGIWFTPYGVAAPETAAEHPDWLLKDKRGNFLVAFAGVNWQDKSRNKGADNYILNVTNPEAVAQWFGMFWHKASETWNNDFFKIDGQPTVAQRYRKSVNGNGAEGYREGLKIARSIVGEEKFINGCYGIPLDGIGWMDGSRTGPDTGGWPHATEIILNWNFLNNVCWWCDPDAAANLYAATVERVRLNAQARVLTGQQFLTDDVWTEVPPENCRVWQQSFPMLDIRPVNLYPIQKDWLDYDLFNLRIAKPWGTWDVAGLFNYTDKPCEKILDLGRLPLDADEVHVYEFWSQSYLGRFPRTGEIPRHLEGFEGQLFSIVPADGDRPILLSTNRHLSQGGLDLQQVSWTNQGDSWTVRGHSTHLVKSDAYELVFAPGKYAQATAESSAGSITAQRDGRVVRVRLEPLESGQADWQATFAPFDGPALAVGPGNRLDLGEGGEAILEIASIGLQGFSWQARPSDPRIHLSAASGKLGPWPERAEVTVNADTSGLPLGQVWNGAIEVQAPGTEAAPAKLLVRLHTPPPPNLALEATATVSSTWSDDYAAPKVNDDDIRTRWNSAQDDKDGCWVALTWPEPVCFDRVVIDECMDFGHRIQAWRLEAGADTPQVIARGQETGQDYTVHLDTPATTNTLRLVVEKASVVPTIRELRVFLWPRQETDAS